MRIGLNAHLLAQQAGYRSAGIHSYIDNLLTYLPGVAPANWQFTAMVGRNNPTKYNNVSLQYSQWNTQKPLNRILWEQTAQSFQLGDFDLYHALAFVAPILLSKPMIVTVYDLTFLRYPERLSTARRLYLRLFTGVTCRRAQRVIAISQSTADDLTNLLNIPASKIDVTPLGYNEAIFKPIPQEQIQQFRQYKNLPERFWLFIGTLEPRKNLVTLLRAYAQLPQSKRLPLICGGGKGWQYEEIFSIVQENNLQDEVIFPGFLADDEVPFWYNSAEVFVYPSVFEGFGLPVLEAMACGIPVITSNVSSLPEVAGNAGLIITPHDVQAWTDALRMAYDDNEWREQARQKGLQKAQTFRWEKTASQTIRSYRRVFGEDYEQRPD